jgi:2-C-methyl-D-erythritol 4-phosphate cytidylyltransferase
LELLRRAYAALDDEVTDDAAAVERLGQPVKMVAGDPRNLKLTTREDLAVARVLLGLPAFEENS